MSICLRISAFLLPCTAQRNSRAPACSQTSPTSKPYAANPGFVEVCRCFFDSRCAYGASSRHQPNKRKKRGADLVEKNPVCGASTKLFRHLYLSAGESGPYIQDHSYPG